MVQFVDLRLTNIGYRFAFFDVENELFTKFNGSHCWLTWEDFKKDVYKEYKQEFTPTQIQKRLIAYHAVVPDWAHTIPVVNAEKTGFDTIAYNPSVGYVTLQHFISFAAFAMDEARATTPNITADKITIENFGVIDGHYVYTGQYSW